MDLQSIATAKDFDFLFKLFRRLSEDNLSYLYRGSFSGKLTSKILNLAEYNIEKIDDKPKVKKRVFAIMVESLQNITKHQAGTEVPEPEGYGFFMIQRLQDWYNITSGNIIQNTDIEMLESKIKYVNSLDRDGLKAYYKKILLGGSMSEKGGAGLGLVDMARKSANQLKYHFKEVDEKVSYFYLQTQLTGDEEPSEEAITYESLDDAQYLHRIMEEKDVHLIYQGGINQENVRQFIAMTEQNISFAVEPMMQKRIISIIIELLQNIYCHGVRNNKGEEDVPGIFVLGKEGGQYAISAGNYIQGLQIEALKSRLEEVNTRSEEQLEDLYSSLLLNDDPSLNGNAGLGLIDMRLKVDQPFQYTIEQIEGDLYFYALQVKI